MPPDASASIPYPALTAATVAVTVIGATTAILVALRRWSGGADRDLLSPRFALSLVVVVGFIALTAYAARNAMPENEAAGQLLGAFISAFTIVVAYWFGPRRNGGQGED